MNISRITTPALNLRKANQSFKEKEGRGFPSGREPREGEYFIEDGRTFVVRDGEKRRVYDFDQR